MVSKPATNVLIHEPELRHMGHRVSTPSGGAHPPHKLMCPHCVNTVDTGSTVQMMHVCAISSKKMTPLFFHTKKVKKGWACFTAKTLVYLFFLSHPPKKKHGHKKTFASCHSIFFGVRRKPEMSSARKLFISIKAPEGFVSDMVKRLGMDAEATNTLAPHVTVQYCGKLATDTDIETIKRIWTDQLAKAQLSPLYDTDICTTGKLDLFGDNNDQLVALCAASPKFCRAVADARERVVTALPHIPKSKYEFSPHITICTATEIPDSGSVFVTSFRFDNLFMLGANDKSSGEEEVRDAIAIPFTDA